MLLVVLDLLLLSNDFEVLGKFSGSIISFVNG